MNSRISQCYTIESINKAYEQGLSNGRYEVEKDIEIIKHNAYQDGRAQAYSELHAPNTERERQLQEKAWDEGYVSAIEDYLSQGGEFIGNVGCYKFGAVDDWEHTPNEETQEAMQEVLDKSSRKHNHYFKDTSKFDEIDTYLLARIWGIEDKNGAYFHAFKKVLDAGKRGNKGKLKDIGEAIDSLKRYIEVEEMFEEYKHD